MKGLDDFMFMLWLLSTIGLFGIVFSEIIYQGGHSIDSWKIMMSIIGTSLFYALKNKKR